jgi:FAD/FMN-containing dehydrogenase
VEASPRVLTIPAPQALLLHHAYGSNGIILEVELALAPEHRWINAWMCLTTSPTP